MQDLPELQTIPPPKMREKGGIDIVHLFLSTWEAELEFKVSKTV